MCEEFQKESVLIWTVGVDHVFCSRVCNDISRFESSVANYPAGSMTFVTWGFIFILDEDLHNDFELEMLVETSWGFDLVKKAREQDCNQIQVIAPYRVHEKVSLELID